jgi:hypothetical protein
MVLKRSSRVLGMIGEKNSATEGEKVDLGVMGELSTKIWYKWL